jgi:large subunit ribosomal protein L21
LGNGSAGGFHRGIRGSSVYAIIRKQSRQVTVRQGDVIDLDLDTTLSPGSAITFDEVLLVGDEGRVTLGKPLVKGARVTAEVIGLVKGVKVIAFRFKRRKNVRKKRGHRQKFTRVKITGIQA